MTTQDDKGLGNRLKRIELLLEEVDRESNPAMQARTREIVQCIMDFHGAALERLLEKLASAGEGGIRTIHSLAEDDLVANLLLLYGQHPLDIAARVANALEQVRPYLHSHGGNVELLGLDDGIVRLRLHGSCHGCPSSALTLRQTIEEAILQKAPDVLAIQVEDESPAPPVPEMSRFSLPILAG